MKKYIYICLGLFFITTVVGIFIYSGNLFVLRKSSGNLGTSEPIVIKFNKKLSPNTLNNFSVKPYTSGKAEIDNDRLLFYPSEGFMIGKEYTYTLINPKSVDGKSSKNVVGSFVAIYKEFNSLSDTSKKDLINKSSSLENRFPIVQILPYEDLTFKINYRFGKDSSKLILTITTFAVLNRPDQKASYANETQAYRQKAIDYIKEKGFKPEDYIIEYEPSDI